MVHTVLTVTTTPVIVPDLVIVLILEFVIVLVHIIIIIIITVIIIITLLLIIIITLRLIIIHALILTTVAPNKLIATFCVLKLMHIFHTVMSWLIVIL